MMLMQRARSAGVFLSARVAIEQRQDMADGVLRQFPVPVIRLDDSLRALAAGTPLAEQLPPQPARLAVAGRERLSITTGPARPAVPDVPDIAVTAGALADQAAKVATRDAVEAIAEQAGRAQVKDDLVWVRSKPGVPDSPLHEVTLHAALTAFWWALPAAAKPVQPAADADDGWPADEPG